MAGVSAEAAGPDGLEVDPWSWLPAEDLPCDVIHGEEQLTVGVVVAGLLTAVELLDAVTLPWLRVLEVQGGFAGVGLVGVLLGWLGFQSSPRREACVVVRRDWGAPCVVQGSTRWQAPAMPIRGAWDS